MKASNEKNTAEAAKNIQIVTFKLANEEYGIDIMRVQEIILVGEITKIPEVPKFIKGIINLRGNVIPVIEMRTRFGFEEKQKDEHTRIIVINVNNKTIGIVVDGVNEVLRINSQEIDSGASVGISGTKDYLKGLVKLKNRILILLDIEKIFSSNEIEKVA